MKAFVNGANIYFDVEGLQLVPDGPKMKENPVCFVVHGGPGGDHTIYKPALSAISDLAQLVYIDNRGSGNSDKTGKDTYTLEQNTDDMEALRKHLGLDKIVVLGQSYGGMLGMRYAIKYPNSVKALILITTSASYQALEDSKEILRQRGTPEQIKFGEVLWEGAFESNEQLEDFFRVFTPLYSYQFDPNDPEQIKASEDAFARVQYSYEALNMGFAGFLRTMDQTPDLHKIKVPTLVIGAKHDWITPPKYSEIMAEKIPNSKLVIMQNSSHLCLSDEYDATIKELREFLSSLK